MKKPILFLVLIFAFQFVWGQLDKHGNPIFNSVHLSEDIFDDFELTSSYYTIKNNIDNIESSVYVSETPDIKDYLTFSRDLPSYFFIVSKGPVVYGLIMLIQKNEGDKTTLSYNIVNPNNGKSITVDCRIWGEFTEKRVEELIKLNIDTNCKILDFPSNGKAFLFNGVAYRIQPYDKLKEEVIEIAKQLTPGKEKKIKKPLEYIKKETIGGKLDFNIALESEQNSLLVYDGIAYNKKDFAIFLWGKSVKHLDINSSKEAIKLWEQIHGRKLTTAESKALKKGFDNKAE